MLKHLFETAINLYQNQPKQTKINYKSHIKINKILNDKIKKESKKNSTLKDKIEKKSNRKKRTQKNTTQVSPS
jgi:hypothetical protein